MNKTILGRFSLLSIALLSACGGTGQDDGEVAHIERSIQGLAIDGYLARGLVFIDSNNNGTRDAWEPFAFTDNEGYFSYNPLTESNYCSESASEQEQQYCLKTTIEYDEIVVRIDGGYDISTGEPFVGQLSRRTQLENGEELVIITPLSSLISSIQSEENESTLFEKLNLTRDTLNLDYFNLIQQNRPDLINVNLKLHKIVILLDDFLTDTYSKIGDDFGTPNDASAFVYQSLAEIISDFDGSLADFLSQKSNLFYILNQAEEKIKAVYEIKGFSIPDANAQGENRVVDVVHSVSKIVDRLISPDASTTNEAEVIAAARSLEVLTAKAIKNLNANDLDEAINFFSIAEQSLLVESLLSELGEENVNLPALINGSFSGADFSSVEALQNLVRVGADLTPFQNIAGLQLKVSDLVKDSNPTDLEDKEFEFYFHGEEGSTSGNFTACAKYIDDASRNSDGSLNLGEGNVEGELISGFWSLLGATSRNNFQSHSLLLTINFLGATYQTIMKPGSNTSLPDGYEMRVRFDTDDGIRNWYTKSDFTPINVEPKNHVDCVSRLGSRL